MNYDDHDVSTWLEIDQDTTDTEELARLFIAQEVSKALDLEEDTGDSDYVCSTALAWSDSLGEELEFQLNQNVDWLSEDNFDRIWELIEELLPYFLETYEPIKDRIDW